MSTWVPSKRLHCCRPSPYLTCPALIPLRSLAPVSLATLDASCIVTSIHINAILAWQSTRAKAEKPNFGFWEIVILAHKCLPSVHLVIAGRVCWLYNARGNVIICECAVFAAFACQRLTREMVLQFRAHVLPSPLRPNNLPGIPPCYPPLSSDNTSPSTISLVVGNSLIRGGGTFTRITRIGPPPCPVCSTACFSVTIPSILAAIFRASSL